MCDTLTTTIIPAETKTTDGSSKPLDLKCSTCSKVAVCGMETASARASHGEYVGIFDILKINIGPSSSHTMAPMLAAKRFVNHLEPSFADVHHVKVHLYGSMALTGKGHTTDVAILLGLQGDEPETVDPDTMQPNFRKIQETNTIVLKSINEVTLALPFVYDYDLVFHMDEELPCHPNGMKFEAFKDDGTLVLEEVYYSTGGGFIRTAQEMEALQTAAARRPSTMTIDTATSTVDEAMLATSPTMSTLPSEPSTPMSQDGLSFAKIPHKSGVPYFFSTAEELLEHCIRENKTIAEIMIDNECVHSHISREEVYARVDRIARTMEQCVERGMRVEGGMPVTNDPRRAAQIKRRLTAAAERNMNDPMTQMDWIALYARAGSEENACGGRVVTAPTNGAAGTIPAVLLYYQRAIPNATQEKSREFLATAAAIGSLCKRNASIAGAEAGCQAEIGSACAMAAGALAAVMGSTLLQIEHAAETGLEHCLGWTCDPLGGLVQVPCIERNCVAAVKAVLSCRLSRMGTGEHPVSLDSCIEVMYKTGQDMLPKYRETSTGGLAIHARRIKL